MGNRDIDIAPIIYNHRILCIIQSRLGLYRADGRGGIVQVDTNMTELYATMKKNKWLEIVPLQARKFNSLDTY